MRHPDHADLVTSNSAHPCSTTALKTQGLCRLYASSSTSEEGAFHDAGRYGSRLEFACGTQIMQIWSQATQHIPVLPLHLNTQFLCCLYVSSSTSEHGAFATLAGMAAMLSARRHCALRLCAPRPRPTRFLKRAARSPSCCTTSRRCSHKTSCAAICGRIPASTSRCSPVIVGHGTDEQQAKNYCIEHNHCAI
jgi:hypothetical protein